MNKHIPSIKAYGVEAQKFNTEVIGLVLNVIADREGNIAAKTNFTKDVYLLRDSILYRLSSLGWHIHTIRKQHTYIENSFKLDPQGHILIYSNNIQSFSFDDFIFNLISLYDYYANLLSYIFISQNKRQIMWNGFSRACMDKNNPVSKLSFSSSVANHENEWVKRLQTFRAEVIHYNLNQSKARQKITWKEGENVEFKVMFSVPEKLSKKLKLMSPVNEEVGIDLQYGVIEIAERSVKWLGDITCSITMQHTNNLIKRV